MKITRHIAELDYSADRWELFSDQDGARSCAARLNRKFMELVNAGNDRDTVESEMSKFMDLPENANLGAADSEPRYVLGSLLRATFDRED